MTLKENEKKYNTHELRSFCADGLTVFALLFSLVEYREVTMIPHSTGKYLHLNYFKNRGT